ncbi:hypothetical protein RHSIM_Rhsim03G0131200 [Rhododendron simsii]|uniref:Uncharacterized protein n=1 Tax=Rhododendron simsii TaxID=118357 RepID=A0A834H9B2_RHOSS|nr:hypothetical protein RHSIM_Rhsim03G0131200 [Rhododendron simsii]
MISHGSHHHSWAVVVPCGSHNPRKPLKLELVIYSSMQLYKIDFLDTCKRYFGALLLESVFVWMPLWKVDIEELKFHQSDATLIIVDKFSKVRQEVLRDVNDEITQLKNQYATVAAYMKSAGHPLPPSPNGARNGDGDHTPSLMEHNGQICSNNLHIRNIVIPKQNDSSYSISKMITRRPHRVRDATENILKINWSNFSLQ